MIKVLVVDDSVFMRKALSRMLEKDASIQVVGMASNGAEALEKIDSLKPDVVTMDIEMPVMNGIEALKRIMQKQPLPVIMFSALTQEGADVTMEALNIGACDFMTKDFSNVSVNISDKQNELIAKVKNVANMKVKFLMKRLELIRKPVMITPDKKVRHEILSIGASTGGPPALLHVLQGIPRDFPIPIVIAQHMPKLFTASFSQRLNAVSQIEVREAEEREPLRPGVALVAPGDTHVELKKRGRETIIEFVREAKYIYRPSVDLLMQSTAAVYESRSIAVILTGMGNDGLAGMREVRKKGGFIIAQNEETCVVYGMPRAVVTADLADRVLPIDKISEEIIRVL
jgi:two-component system, chemotaxis family, protein-glutamate methylesterase/glutaminase